MDNYEEKKVELLTKLVNLDGELSVKATEASDLKWQAQQLVSPIERAIEETRLELTSLLRETGESEFTLEGKNVDYKVSFTKPRETVKVVDVDAVPDRLCKLERKPMLKEIKQELDDRRCEGQALPNWAGFQLGSSSLVWKAIKKKAKAS